MGGDSDARPMPSKTQIKMDDERFLRSHPELRWLIDRFMEVQRAPAFAKTQGTKTPKKQNARKPRHHPTCAAYLRAFRVLPPWKGPRRIQRSSTHPCDASGVSAAA